jgi:hypothetical protein
LLRQKIVKIYLKDLYQKQKVSKLKFIKKTPKNEENLISFSDKHQSP